LPARVSFVAPGVPSTAKAGTKVRIKITKLELDEDRVPLMLEWLTNEPGERPEHLPMKIWLKNKSDPASALPWQKLMFSELNNKVVQPLEIAGVLRPATNRAVR
jgi:hypothetical protein